MVSFLYQLRRVAKLTGPRRRIQAQRAKKNTLACESLETRVLLSAITGTIYDDVDSSGTKTGGDNTLGGWQVFRGSRQQRDSQQSSGRDTGTLGVRQRRW